MDLMHLPVIDNHCHPFVSGREPAQFEQSFCTGFYGCRAEDMRHTLYFQMMMGELRAFFGLPADTADDEVIALRNHWAKNKRKEYAARLFADGNIAGFVCDFGYPISRVSQPERYLRREEIAEYLDNCGDVTVKAVDRIEWVANPLLEQSLSFEEFERQLEENAELLVKEQSLIALKTVIAYYTGLEVKPLERETFAAGYSAYLRNREDRAAEKTVRDFTFLKAAEICRQLQIPLQIHTGVGSPYCGLKKCNPILLTEALASSWCSETKMVLVHAGYPYVEEMGLLLNHCPNVYADISFIVPYGSIAGEDKLRRLMEFAPLNKLCYGTDGGTTPESLWFGAKQFKRILGKVLGELEEQGVVREEFALETAENILYRNVERIYGITVV